MYPTTAISFIGLRRGGHHEPSHVIHCCGDNSRYDPLQGARVIDGPAPQPLAAVLLEWDDKSDQLHAVGTRGGEMFDAFFEKYAISWSSRPEAACANRVVPPSSCSRPRATASSGEAARDPAPRGAARETRERWAGHSRAREPVRLGLGIGALEAGEADEVPVRGAAEQRMPGAMRSRGPSV